MTDKNTLLDDTLKKLNNLYSKVGYMDKHGSDVWITAFVCIVFMFLIYYYYYSNVLEVIRADWQNKKCNPLIIPFAGFINKPAHQSNLEFTADNFTICISSILHYITNIAVNPFRIVLSIINKTIQTLVQSFNMLREMIDTLRKNSSSIIDTIKARMYNILTEIIRLLINSKDVMGKAGGVLITSVYTLFGSFMAMVSLFLSMLDLMTLILIIIACMIYIFIGIALGTFPIPIIGPAAATPTIITASIIAGIMILILIPVIIFMVFMLRVLKLSVPPPPKVPSCFSKDTMIPLFEHGEKNITDIQLGDKLKNGGIVTATLKLDASEQNIYCLKGVYVTGEHRVYHSSMKWIKVKEHPESIFIPTFNEPYVYCLNTTNKEFLINDVIFSDWDDIDDKIIKDLTDKCVSFGYLPEQFTYDDIHTYLDSGFIPCTTVKLDNGKYIPICDVNVNDILENNTKVLGVVKIDGRDITQYNHIFGNTEVGLIGGSKNIHINDPFLGIINCIQEKHTIISEKLRFPVLYHLLTDKKFYNVNGIQVNDYNYGIDAYTS